MASEQTKLDVEIKPADKKLIESVEEGVSLGSWLNLNLSDDKLQEITDNILKEIDIIDGERKPIYEKVKQYRNQYNQIVEETSIPFPSCFNLCVPSTTKAVDTCLAQTEEAFEDVDPKWSINTPPDKNLIPSRDMQEKTLDYYSDSEMEDTEAWSKVYHDAFLLGTGWLCMVFKREFLKVRDFVEYSTIEQFQNDFPDDYLKYPKYLEKLSQGEIVKMVVEYNQEVCRSAKPEHAEWEDIYVPLNTNGLNGMLKARLIARYVPMRWEEIWTLEKQGDYRKGTAETLKMTQDSKGTSTDEIDPDYLKKTYDTFEVIYFVDIDNDEIEERCLFNIEKSHKLGMRDIYYPYNHNRPYAIPYYIQNTEKGIYQIGFGEKLQYINIAQNAVLNHVLNASIIANSLSLKVRANTDAVKALYEHQWFPGSILELMNTDDVQQFTFNTPNLSSLITLFASLERFGDDAVGITNYMVGQSDPEDPSAPASKTMALMRKSELKLRKYIKTLKRSNNEAGYQALRLIYQYVPKSRIAKILGIGEDEVTGLFQYPLKPITQASGFAVEKMFEKRDNIQMLQLLMKEPIVVQDTKRRMALYRVVAKDYGSNWDKKIELIIPSNEEIDKMAKMAQDAKDQKKMNVIKSAFQQAMSKGANQQEAEDVGRAAGKKYDELLAQQGQKQGQKLEEAEIVP